jgi:hypothetical protein
LTPSAPQNQSNHSYNKKHHNQQQQSTLTKPNKPKVFQLRIGYKPQARLEYHPNMVLKFSKPF